MKCRQSGTADVDWEDKAASFVINLKLRGIFLFRNLIRMKSDFLLSTDTKVVVIKLKSTKIKISVHQSMDVNTDMLYSLVCL